MAQTIIKGAALVNEGRIIHSDILFREQRIEKIGSDISVKGAVQEMNGEGYYLMPGLIDDQVHFREPGLTHKAEIHSESCAAVAGGVTSFMEMPNVKPPTLTMELLEEKYAIAAARSPANYSFFMGVSNDNVEEALKINKRKHDICGLKIFMGSSTGNMLVDNIVSLEKIFSRSEVLIATHCEQENIIRNNLQKLLDSGIQPDHASMHPVIRDVEACYQSSLGAIQLAKKFDTRLHILHISTARELQLFTNMFPLEQKRITAEVCVHHLHFTADDYHQYGNLVKCNPAIKAAENREALWEALLDDRLDIIATDHAPHTLEEKQLPYMEAPSGLPLVQHSLNILLQAFHEGRITLEKIVEKACHAPARCFGLAERGYLREGYFADAVLVHPDAPYKVTRDNILYKCGWSPFEGHTFKGRVEKTWVNGALVFDGQAVLADKSGQRLTFHRN